MTKKYVQEQSVEFEELKKQHQKLQEECTYMKSKATAFNKLTITMKDQDELIKKFKDDIQKLKEQLADQQVEKDKEMKE